MPAKILRNSGPCFKEVMYESYVNYTYMYSIIICVCVCVRMCCTDVQSCLLFEMLVFVTLREEHTPRALRTRLLRGIFRSKGKEVTGE